MFSNDEEAQKRELAQGFLHFLVDGAAGQLPDKALPSLSAALAEKVSRDTRRQVAELLPQYLDQALPAMLQQAATGGRTQSAEVDSLFGRYGKLLLGVIAVLVAGYIALAALYVLKPGQPAGQDPADTTAQIVGGDAAFDATDSTSPLNQSH